MRVGSEQCDDGNTTNLDGCDASCKFEQVQRMTQFKVAFMHSTTCTKDAMGEAIVGNDAFGQAGSRTQITQAIDGGIKDGSITGSPATSSAATLDGTNDLDWWYATDAASIDASRVPVRQLNGSFAARTLSTSPGEILVTVNFVGVAVTMDIFHATLTANVNASGALTASTNGMTPGHLASEHDAPSLTSFLTMGTPGTTSGCSSVNSTCRCFSVTGSSGTASTCPTGELCGVTTARSLYNVVMPSSLTGATCSNFYTTSNRLLDTYISGCKYSNIFTEVKVTQPDSAIDDNGNLTNDVYVFTPGSNGTLNHSVELGTCTKNGVADTLDDCLDHAAYSSLFQFTTDRVIAK